MTKRKSRKQQKGGDWNPMTWFSTSSTQSWKDYFSNLGTKTTEGVGNLTNNIENAMSTFQSEPAPTTQSAPTQPAPTTQTFGGRSKRRRTMKGGLGLTYYASPVSGLRVAEPTTWQHYANGTNQYSTKGGRKSRRRKRH
jgi:hypothetical protein